jgi:hypothetical protein
MTAYCTNCGVALGEEDLRSVCIVCALTEDYPPPDHRKIKREVKTNEPAVPDRPSFFSL